MKKLFVLFLLVALVPFTVGCGLFGDNDDTSPVAFTKLTATATLPAAAAGLNLRALVALRNAQTFKDFTLSINGVILTAETEEETVAGWVVTFGRIVTAAELETAKAGVVPLVVSSKTGTKVVDTYINSTSVGTTSQISVVLTAVGANPTVAVGGEPVSIIDTPVTMTIANTLQGVKPAFTATFGENIFDGITFVNNTLPSSVVVDVDVRKAGSTFRDASASDFTFSYNTTGNVLTVTLANKSLTIGQAYEVVVRSIKVNGVEKVAYKSYSFTATAQ